MKMWEHYTLYTRFNNKFFISIIFVSLNDTNCLLIGFSSFFAISF